MKKDFKDLVGFPSLEDMTSMRRKAEAQRSKARAWTAESLADYTDIKPGGAPIFFNMLSLGAWLKVADLAGVDAIPAKEIMRLTPDEVAVLVLGPDPELASRATLDPDEIHDRLLAALPAGEMLRFDPGAPPEIKHQMSSGRAMSDGTLTTDDGTRMIPLCDERLLVICEDHGAPHIPVFSRPIVEPARITGTSMWHPYPVEGSWPAEFRVFVRDGEVVGIANYYRQIGMEPDRFASAAHDACQSSRRICEVLRAGSLYPRNQKIAPSLSENDGTGSFTLDFLVPADDENRVLLLEGGPEGWSRADPCSFLRLDPDPANPTPIEGFAFSSLSEPLPLSLLTPSGVGGAIDRAECEPN